MTSQSQPSTNLLAKNQLDFSLIVGILETLKDKGAGTPLKDLLEQFSGDLAESWSEEVRSQWHKKSAEAKRKQLERTLERLKDDGLIQREDHAIGRGHLYRRTPGGKEYVTRTTSQNQSRLQQDHISGLLKIYMSAQEYQVVEASVFPEEHPHFESLSQWFRVVPDRQTYARTPNIDEDLLEDLLHALREHKQLRVLYRSKAPASATRKAEWRDVNPLWLVMRNGVLYLVATLDKAALDKASVVPANLRQLAVHRIEDLEICEDRPILYPEDFSVDDYITSHAFDYPMQGDPIQLVLRIFPTSWYDPREYPLSEDQTVQEEADHSLRVTAPGMADTWELRRWLLGMAQHAEVLAPGDLRDWFGQTVGEMARRYMD